MPLRKHVHPCACVWAHNPANTHACIYHVNTDKHRHRHPNPPKSMCLTVPSAATIAFSNDKSQCAMPFRRIYRAPCIMSENMRRHTGSDNPRLHFTSSKQSPILGGAYKWYRWEVRVITPSRPAHATITCRHTDLKSTFPKHGTGARGRTRKVLHDRIQASGVSPCICTSR